MKIINLKAENIMVLKAVDITPDKDKSLVVIGGENDAGKSAVLNLVKIAFEGKAALPPVPVRQGQESGWVRCELEDLVIKRTVEADRTTELVVSGKDGSEYRRPQEILDKVRGLLGFDPLKFARQKPAEQHETLSQLLGLDFSELDRHRKAAFDSRTTENREVKRLAALLGDLPPHVDAPEAEVVVADLVQELEKRQHENAQRKELRDRAARLVSEAEDLEDAINDMKDRQDELRKEAETATQGYDLTTEANEQETRQQIDEAQGLNAAIRDNHTRTRLEQSLKETRQDVRNSEEVMRKIDADKAAQLKAAKMPVPGLSLGDDCVLYKGLPFEQESSSGRVRVSTAVGLTMCPELRVLLLENGSLLGERNRAIVDEMASAAGAQVWMEVVGTGGNPQVVIEDGMVKK